MGVWGEKTHKCHGVSKARKPSVIIVITWWYPQTRHWPGGSDRDSGLRKCLENSRQVLHSHAPWLLLLASAGVLGWSQEEEALPPFTMVWGWVRILGLNPTSCQKTAARPGHRVPWQPLCVLERHPQEERQISKTPPVNVSELQRRPLLQGQPGPSPWLHDSPGSFPPQPVSTRGQAHHASWAPRN